MLLECLLVLLLQLLRPLLLCLLQVALCVQQHRRGDTQQH
jgi:hypothetical protein